MWTLSETLVLRLFYTVGKKNFQGSVLIKSYLFWFSNQNLLN